jgi:hypothetical protein
MSLLQICVVMNYEHPINPIMNPSHTWHYSKYQYKAGWNVKLIFHVPVPINEICSTLPSGPYYTMFWQEVLESKAHASALH